MAEQRIPGPPSPPIVPGDMGTPERDTLDRLAATLGMFDWLEANGLLTGEVKRLHVAFMFEHGPLAKRWLDQADPPPSWSQMADLLKEKQALATKLDALQAGLWEARTQIGALRRREEEDHSHMVRKVVAQRERAEAAEALAAKYERAIAEHRLILGATRGFHGDEALRDHDNADERLYAHLPDREKVGLPLPTADDIARAEEVAREHGWLPDKGESDE